MCIEELLESDEEMSSDQPAPTGVRVNSNSESTSDETQNVQIDRTNWATTIDKVIGTVYESLHFFGTLFIPGFVGYVISYCGLSIWWLSIVIVVALCLRHKVAIPLQEVNQRADAREKDLPDWIKYPDHETMKWINKTMKKMWPFLRTQLKDACVEKIIRPLAQQHSIAVNEIDFGSSVCCNQF